MEVRAFFETKLPPRATYPVQLPVDFTASSVPSLHSLSAVGGGLGGSMSFVPVSSLIAARSDGGVPPRLAAQHLQQPQMAQPRQQSPQHRQHAEQQQQHQQQQGQGQGQVRGQVLPQPGHGRNETADSANDFVTFLFHRGEQGDATRKRCTQQAAAAIESYNQAVGWDTLRPRQHRKDEGEEEEAGKGRMEHVPRSPSPTPRQEGELAQQPRHEAVPASPSSAPQDAVQGQSADDAAAMGGAPAALEEHEQGATEGTVPESVPVPVPVPVSVPVPVPVLDMESAAQAAVTHPAAPLAGDVVSTALSSDEAFLRFVVSLREEEQVMLPLPPTLLGKLSSKTASYVYPSVVNCSAQ